MTGLKVLKKIKLISQKVSFELDNKKITSSKDITEILNKIHELEGNELQEFFYVLLLNRANVITGYYVASMGGVTGTVADPRLIIKAAALSDCTSIILSHNHPSGNTKPSRADEELTQKIKQAASYFDIKILDHLIISESCEYYSFADEGFL